MSLPLAEEHRVHYIDGRWHDSAKRFPVYNPATGEQLAEVADGGEEEVRRAVDAAAAAFPAWAGLSARERGQALLRIARRLEERQEELARLLTLEQGKPLPEARAELRSSSLFFEWYGEEAKRVYGSTVAPWAPDKRHVVLRQPVGVVGAITPWNFPSSMIARKIAPALAAGCTVVLKPAEQTPLSALAIFEVMDECGLPAGVANLVLARDPQPVGQVLLSDARVRKISFTGSTEVGRRLMRGAADQLKRLSLELGGHAPFIVFDDANLDQAVAGALECKFRNVGQTCISANRIYVHSRVFDAFAEKLATAVKGLRVGYGLHEGVQIGPVIDEHGFAKVQEHVRDAREQGAEVIAGGAPAQVDGGLKGYFFQPTLLAGVKPAMRILKEETFGPVAPLVPFEDEDEAVALANDTEYGLAAYFYTESAARAIRVSERLEYGIIGINDGSPATVHTPFGGMKQSGFGREGGREGIEAFLETKHLSIKIPLA